MVRFPDGPIILLSLRASAFRPLLSQLDHEPTVPFLVFAENHLSFFLNTILASIWQ